MVVNFVQRTDKGLRFVNSKKLKLLPQRGHHVRLLDGLEYEVLDIIRTPNEGTARVYVSTTGWSRFR